MSEYVAIPPDTVDAAETLVRQLGVLLEGQPAPVGLIALGRALGVVLSCVPAELEPEGFRLVGNLSLATLSAIRDAQMTAAAVSVTKTSDTTVEVAHDSGASWSAMLRNMAMPRVPN